MSSEAWVVLLSVTNSGVEMEDTSIEPLTLATLARRFSSIAGAVVWISDFIDDRALLYVKITSHHSLQSIQDHHLLFKHSQEGDIAEVVKNISSEAKLWIAGNKDAAGIRALSVASCIVAQSPEYQVFSVLFEDHYLDEAAREKIVHDLRNNSLLLEQSSISAGGLAGASGALAAYFPPNLKALDVEIELKALGIESGASSKLTLAFVGRVKPCRVSVGCVEIGAEIWGCFNVAMHILSDAWMLGL
ncbi:hypothetical protein L210DRAFT_3504517 [Boletus edulis BED1]|uniref:Uncharacterized protein n=1 Tax=Boletus edulis BED1 TaxID=1328754 RepID=A0AAD4BT46_BOLED|nr:hypothetical protein L210DRAFT_3504517 [Boletus edulis BED1]